MFPKPNSVDGFKLYYKINRVDLCVTRLDKYIDKACKCNTLEEAKTTYAALAQKESRFGADQPESLSVVYFYLQELYMNRRGNVLSNGYKRK